MKTKITLLALFLAFSIKCYSQIMFTEVIPSPFLGVREGAVAFADIDGDGDQDCVMTGVATNNTRAINLYRNDGNGDFEIIASPFTAINLGSVAFADVDGDSDQDLLITGDAEIEATAKLYLNDGTGQFTEVVTPLPPVHLSSGKFVDVDNDGDQDILISGQDSSSADILQLYLNDGSGNYSLSPNGTFDGISYGAHDIADIDGDGDQDFFVTGLNNGVHQARMYKNNGTGTFTVVPNTTFVAVYRGDAKFSDIDGDNDQDLLIAGSIDDGTNFRTRLYTNDGSGAFTEVQNTGLQDMRDGALAFADMDSDGDLDLLLAGKVFIGGVDAIVYSNNGSGTFTELLNVYFYTVTLAAVAFQDVDGDNDMDLVITGRNGNSQSNLYLNSSVLGIADYQAEKPIKFYPNPSEEFITIQNISEESTMEIFDVNGKILMQINVDSNSNSVNISSLSNGIYVVKLNNQFVGKLVKE